MYYLYDVYKKLDVLSLLKKMIICWVLPSSASPLRPQEHVLVGPPSYSASLFCKNKNEIIFDTLSPKLFPYSQKCYSSIRVSQISKVINHSSQIWESRIQVINTASLPVVCRSDLFICAPVFTNINLNIVLKSTVRTAVSAQARSRLALAPVPGSVNKHVMESGASRVQKNDKRLRTRRQAGTLMLRTS